MNDVLTIQQITELKESLLTLRDTLTQEIDEDLQQSRESASYNSLAGDVHDSAEESVAEQLSALEAEMANRHTTEIHDIDAALERIENGSYGICIECGQQIGLKRLQAYPIAKRCIECKKKFEQQFTDSRIPSL
jgi:RNA polymerase-binding protein DksA